MITLLFSQISQYRSVTSRMEAMKLETYIDIVTDYAERQEKEKEIPVSLEDFVNNKIPFDSFVGYLLSILNYKLHLRGNQMTVSHKGFISLRSKFMLILSSMLNSKLNFLDIMLKKIAIQNTGILIHIASRICKEVNTLKQPCY